MSKTISGFFKRKNPQMIFDTRFKISFDQSVSDFTEALPWLCIAFAVIVTTSFVIWLIIHFGECCFARARSAYKKKRPGCGKSAFRVFILCFATVVGSFGYYVSCNMLGVSFFNILFGYGIIVAIGLNTFSPGLSCIGGYILLALTNKLTEDEFIEYEGIKGRVSEINLLYVVLEYTHPVTKKVRLRKIPTVNFITRDYDEVDQTAEEMPPQVGRQYATGLKY